MTTVTDGSRSIFVLTIPEGQVYDDKAEAWQQAAAAGGIGRYTSWTENKDQVTKHKGKAKLC